MASTASSKAARGGIDLGGTKIQTVSSTRATRSSDRRASPPPRGRAGRCRRADRRDARDAASAAGVKTEDLLGIGVGSPGVVEPDGTVSTRATCRAGRARSRSARGSGRGVGAPVSSATTSRSRPTPSSSSAPASRTIAARRVLGDRRRRRADPRRQAVDRSRRRRRDRPRGRQHRRRKCGCGRLGCMEAYAGRASMEARAREREDKGAKTDLFKLMKERDRTRLTSGDLGARAREGRQARDRADRRRGRGARGRRRLAGQPARCRGA